MSAEPYIPYNLPDITEEEVQSVASALRSGWLAKGPRTAEFEEAFRSYANARYAVALNSCTAALHLSLVAAGIKPGDEVITTPMTFVSSANTILHAGATPVFADIDRTTGLIDPASIEAKITSKTKAIVPVHYAGMAVDLDAIYRIADQHGLYVSEDAAHAIDTYYRGRRIGEKSQGAVAYSFYATKNLATGEGGMLLTDREDIAEKARVLSSHGMSRNAWNRYGQGGSWRYDVEEIGYKYNMFDIQAALGLVQLKRLPEFQARRFEIAHRYQEAFQSIPGLETVLADPKTVTPAWHLYILRVTEAFGLHRDALIEGLKERQIGTSVHFIPVPEMSVYRKRGYVMEDVPNTQAFADEILSLPLYSRMTDEEVDRVIEAIQELSYEAQRHA